MKNLFKKPLIMVLASRPVAVLTTRLFGYGIPIFMLHRMAPDGYANPGRITPKHLRCCLQYLVDHGYRFISLEDLVLALASGQTIPPKGVVFTMDDGFMDQAEFAAPVFLEFDCPLTFFVITGLLNQTMWPWDAQVSWLTETANVATLVTGIDGRDFSLSLKDTTGRRQARHLIQDAIRECDADRIPEIMERLARDADVTIPANAPQSYKPLDWHTARQLEKAGIQFAPHSVTHNILTRLSDQSLEQEIHGSWESLQQQLEKPLNVFCYPRGRKVDFGDRETRALREAGFLGGVSTIPGFIESHGDQESQAFCLPRFALPGSIENFIQYCSWIEYAKERRKRSSASR